MIWWIAIAALATWVLARTRVGNWIFAVGGDANAARNVGVPVARVKIALFMTTSIAAALVGIMIALRLSSVQAGQGIGEEFTYIIAAVVGGCLLTGGYGSAIGASLGALIVGMAFIGIQFSGWNTDWRFLFLGVILLLAVLVNNLSASARRERGDDRDDAPLLEVRGVSKYFGNVIALKDISLGVDAGEVTCVLGDNGAGKSSFIKILSGVHQHDEGELLVEGEEVHFKSPRDARERGIATVFQDLATVPLMSVWRNFFLGSEPTVGKGPLRRIDVKHRAGDDARGDAQDGHRRARPRPAGRHAVGRRAPGGRDRARGLLRRQGADPRRADVGARRQAVRRRAALRRAGARARARRDLHHAQPAPRLPGRRPLRGPQPRQAAGRLARAARSRATSS